MASFLSQSLPCSRQSLARTLYQSQARASPLTLRFSSSVASRTAATTTKTATPQSFTRPPTPAPAKSPEELAASLGYIVRRTPSVQLPIYRTWKSGNTRQVITIKKIDGDKRKMLQELSEALSVDKGNIRINPTTQHIELKGDYFDQARSWLLERGF
ncbi:hypothetical protein K4F52_003580 [Lecanicillium sp. MT-2017a]|nr:hypothetical protein K4F52_003580 [Lecanicillium sp. MT-2017a]